MGLVLAALGPALVWAGLSVVWPLVLVAEVFLGVVVLVLVAA